MTQHPRASRNRRRLCELRRVVRPPVGGRALSVDVCSNCHPAYTGSDARRDVSGSRIDRFNRRLELAAA